MTTVVKLPVNIKLQPWLYDAVDTAREDITRTRFIERILEGDVKARAALDAAIGRESVPVEPPEPRVIREPQPPAPPDKDTTGGVGTPPRKRAKAAEPARPAAPTRPPRVGASMKLPGERKRGK